MHSAIEFRMYPEKQYKEQNTVQALPGPASLPGRLKTLRKVQREVQSSAISCGNMTVTVFTNGREDRSVFSISSEKDFYTCRAVESKRLLFQTLRSSKKRRASSLHKSIQKLILSLAHTGPYLAVGTSLDLRTSNVWNVGALIQFEDRLYSKVVKQKTYT